MEGDVDGDFSRAIAALLADGSHAHGYTANRKRAWLTMEERDPQNGMTGFNRNLLPDTLRWATPGNAATKSQAMGLERQPAPHRPRWARTAAAVGLLVLAAMLPGRARAVTIAFSFSGPGLGYNASLNSWGNYAGTVTGLIYGLVDNSTSAASDVVITSVPAAMESYLPSNPYSVMGLPITVNSFTLVHGVVTAADFQAGGTGYLDLNTAGEYNVFGPNAENVGNTSGFSGATYSLASVSVPEPPAGVMLLSFAAMLGFALSARSTPPGSCRTRPVKPGN